MSDEAFDMLADIEATAARFAAAGPFPVLLRVAPDVWDQVRALAARDAVPDVLRPVAALSDQVSGVPVKLDDDLPAGEWRAEMSDGSERSSEDVCEHVPLDASGAVAVLPPPPAPGYTIRVRCPCCQLTGWRKPDDDLADDECPYCDVQAVRVT